MKKKRATKREDVGFMTEGAVIALNNYVMERYPKPEDLACDGTLRRTIAALQSLGIPVEEAVEWLKDNGGHCDCEVILNVMVPRWGD